MWKRHEVARGGEGRKELNHPVAGKLVFEHAVFNPVEVPEQRRILYSPVPEADTSAKLERLLEDEPFHSPLALGWLSLASALFESSSSKFTVLSQSNGGVAP